MVFEKVAFYWLVCLVIVAVLLGVLRLLITLSGAQRRRRGFAGLHRDQQGSVQSLSFVMTLPVFIMIMMGIIQIGQIMLAKVVVEYAALASTRAATVWISQYTNAENGLEEQRNCVGNESIQRSDSTYHIETENSKSSKINRIAMAAQLALLPICPSRWPYSDEPNLSGVATQTHASLVKAYSAMAGEKSNTPDEAISKRLKNKLAYSQANTKIEIEMEHPESDPPFRDYSYAYQVNRAYYLSQIKVAHQLTRPRCRRAREAVRENAGEMFSTRPVTKRKHWRSCRIKLAGKIASPSRSGIILRCSLVPENFCRK